MAPGWMSRLPSKMSRNSPWSRPGRLVLSSFQARMSRVGGAHLQGDGDGAKPRLAVGVETPPAMLLAGIATGDHEERDALGNGVLDEAAPGAESHEVVLVDRRRDHDHGTGPHRGSGRL